MPKKFLVTASNHTDMAAYVNAPDHYSADDVMDWYKKNGANGEFEDNGNDWVWGEAQEVPDGDEPEYTIGDAPNMSLQQFVDSKIIGRRNVYYCGTLCIHKTDDPDTFEVILGNMSISGDLSHCEKALYESLGYLCKPDSRNRFDPEIQLAGKFTHAGMIDLLADYCDFYGIEHMSADELAADTILQDFHRQWFIIFDAVWNDIPEPEIIASPYKWICDDCGSETVYQEASAYWDFETQTITLSDGTDETGDWYCGDCGAECCGKKVEIAE